MGFVFVEDTHMSFAKGLMRQVDWCGWASFVLIINV